ncbi:threonine dehydratase-like protein [Tumebacillus sp. BK434]|nr:threonine dehydratase-like protein [Tumebacillus sp. BK434]
MSWVIVQQLKVEAHKVVTIEPTANLNELLTALDSCGFQHIPVVADGAFFGMVGYADVHKAYFESGSADKEQFLTETKVDAITVNKNATIHEEGSIEDILLAIDRVPFIAVLSEEGTFTGIVTHSANFEMLRDALGMHKPGIRMTVSMPEMQGSLLKFADVVRKYSNIFGLLVLDDDADFGYRRVSFKVAPDADVDAITEDLRQVGVRVFHVTR